MLWAVFPVNPEEKPIQPHLFQDVQTITSQDWTGTCLCPCHLTPHPPATPQTSHFALCLVGRGEFIPHSPGV